MRHFDSMNSARLRACCLMTVLVLVAILLMPAGVYATNAAETEIRSYIYDEPGLFTEEQYRNLQEQAASVSNDSQCGVYFVAVNDFNDYSTSGDVQTAAEDIYIAKDFGLGEEKNGVMLLLSMSQRDYALIAYGAFAHTAFTDYGKEVMSENFLDDFADDHWYSGCLDYVSDCQSFTELAMTGTPFDWEGPPEGSVYDDYYDGGYYEERSGSLLMAVFVALLPAAAFSMVICIILRRQMRTARKKTDAFEYIAGGMVDFRVKQDMFTHVTHSRRKIQTNSGSKSGGGGKRSGTRVGSRGFSGRKGKF